MPEVLTAVVVVSIEGNSLDVVNIESVDVYSLTDGVSLVLSISVDEKEDVSRFVSVAIVDSRVLKKFIEE